MLLKSKEDIEFHSDGYRDSKPAVNVKVYDSLTNGFCKWKRDNPDENPHFTLDWIEAHVSDESLQQGFWSMCEMRWDDLETEAQEIWGSHMYTDRYGARKHSIKVYSEGRSGGWAIVDGINNDVSSWDAIEFTQWKRFAKFARAVADGIMWDVVDSIYNNAFEEWKNQ